MAVKRVEGNGTIGLLDEFRNAALELRVRAPAARGYRGPQHLQPPGGLPSEDVLRLAVKSRSPEPTVSVLEPGQPLPL